MTTLRWMHLNLTRARALFLSLCHRHAGTHRHPAVIDDLHIGDHVAHLDTHLIRVLSLVCNAQHQAVRQ
jgi:hypothetical protein